MSNFTFTYNDSNLQMNSQLILCIKGLDSIEDNNSIDNIMFIGWDYTDNVYYIRGKRQDILDRNFVPYAFKCENEYDTYNFIEFVIGCKNLSSIILYNFNNISEMHYNDITYEFLEENIDINYEISGYDNVKVTCSPIVSCLKMLKNVF